MILRDKLKKYKQPLTLLFIADKEASDAEAICKHIGIEFQQVNFVKEYWNDVFTGKMMLVLNYNCVNGDRSFNPTLFIMLINFIGVVTDYEAGLTPNPDVECNRYLKFGHFR